MLLSPNGRQNIYNFINLTDLKDYSDRKARRFLFYYFYDFTFYDRAVPCTAHFYFKREKGD
ncbi:MAG: hypothetical protein EGR86_11510 [Ruminiclostridium sp.]|nr:hypothetical protein [Ruminiclostridium sp.]